MWFSSSKHNFQFQTHFCIFSCRRIVSLRRTLGHSCNQTLFLCVCYGTFYEHPAEKHLNKLVKRVPEPSVKTSNRPPEIPAHYLMLVYVVCLLFWLSVPCVHFAGKSAKMCLWSWTSAQITTLMKRRSEVSCSLWLKRAPLRPTIPQ